MFNGFEPIYDQNSKILILGSFPSVKSREFGFYYGNPQNRFWRTLEGVYNEKIDTSDGEIAGKIAFLKSHGIALWDSVDKCSITGSGDADINSGNSTPSNVDELITKTNVRAVACNGKKAFEVFSANNRISGFDCILLPSTSSANARFDFEKWRETLIKYTF